jgi:hypothetical protein
MNWFKFFPFYIIFVFSVGYLYLNYNYSPKKKVDPISSKNDFVFQLNQALAMSQLKVDHLVYKDFNNQIEFNTSTTKVILSDQKDPFWQIASLQQILNRGKINNNLINFIDLSIKHPYATFQNN